MHYIVIYSPSWKCKQTYTFEYKQICDDFIIEKIQLYVLFEFVMYQDYVSGQLRYLL